MEKVSEQIMFVRKRVGDLLKVAITDNQDILDILKAAQKKIAKETLCFENEYETVTVEDQESYSLPTNFCQHKSTCRVGDYSLSYKRRSWLQKTMGDEYDDSDSEPDYFWIERGLFGLWKKYNANGENILLPYYRYPYNMILGPTGGQPAITLFSAAGATIEAGTYYYKITFYDSVNGIESEPYYIGYIEVTVSSTYNIRLGSTLESGAKLPKSYDKDVNRIKIYRTLKNGDRDLGPYYYVGYADNGDTAYEDDDSDAVISQNSKLSEELGFYEVPERYSRDEYGKMMCYYVIAEIFEEDEEYSREAIFRAKFNEGMKELRKYLGESRHKAQAVQYREF